MNRLRVLNVDDDPIALYVKSRMLRDGGHEVVEAASGGEALQRVAEGGIDIILLDVKLPDINGFDVAQRIRASSRSSDLPILQVSAICVTADDEDDGLKSGADAFLVPPLQGPQLLEAIEAVMRRRGAGARPAAHSRLRERDVQKVRELVRGKIDAPHTVEELARALGLSPFHFARAFKAATGQTPHEYVTQERMREARRLLERTELPLAAIARQVGYRTHSHFSTVFLAHCGQSPRAWRKAKA
ncbi:MAG TPA: DNA-binding response regulator [Usitatibacter sp.]|nr:DNA-binding response regulator [Usitatibacter sp.]